jgi:hypothetical protein
MTTRGTNLGTNTMQPTAMMSGRYQKAYTVAVIFLVAGWHLAGAGGQLLRDRPAFGSFAFQAPCGLSWPWRSPPVLSWSCAEHQAGLRPGRSP